MPPGHEPGRPSRRGTNWVKVTVRAYESCSGWETLAVGKMPVEIEICDSNKRPENDPCPGLLFTE